MRARSKTGEGGSNPQGQQRIVIAAKIMIAESSSAENMPQGAPGPGARGGILPPVTMMISPHVMNVLQQLAVAMIDLAPIGHKRSQPAASELPPAVLQTALMQNLENPPTGMVYHRINLMVPRGIGQTQGTVHGSKIHLEPMSQYVCLELRDQA